MRYAYGQGLPEQVVVHLVVVVRDEVPHAVDSDPVHTWVRRLEFVGQLLRNRGNLDQNSFTGVAQKRPVQRVGPVVSVAYVSPPLPTRYAASAPNLRRSSKRRWMRSSFTPGPPRTGRG